ncbi:gamma-glutamyltransferase [Larkinella sp. VNQ87]|uniref:gamma-glutamyltransferase n=1 Tax=Larkinella sp. VNQ87 TaxID=3400921 RepID=UPI003C12A981
MTIKLLFALIGVFLLRISGCSVQAQDRLSGRAFATRSVVMARHGMACTAHPLATQAAIEVLRSGGNAIDAAIAANAVEGVVEPNMNGIGGDLFAIVWDAKSQKLYGLNASGRSPYGLTSAQLKAQNLTRIPLNGPLSVSVPGCVDGWFELHKRFGKLPMNRLLTPAIEYARDGFPVHDETADSWPDMLRKFGTWPNVRETYAPGGVVPARGTVFKNPALSKTLETIAKGGRDAFYKGNIARTIDAFMKKTGGYLSYRDLSEHTSDWIEPVSTTYRGHTIWELPPNGQGIAVLQMLNILEGYDFSKIPWGSPEHVHLFTEAKKLAFEDRARFYADPAFATIPVNELISKAYAAERRKRIDPERASLKPEAGNPLLKNGDTIYLTVADSEGNMVSLIQSIFLQFGSGVVPDGLGFVLQNRGALFTLKDGEANAYAPHKRPFHTIIPSFVTKDGKPWLSFGVMGGSFQPLGHVQILMNLIDFGMNIQEAGDAPRIDHQGSSEPTGDVALDGGFITLESGFPYETIRELMRKGHKVSYSYGLYGGYQAIQYDSVHQIYHGASDARKDGQAAGY